MAHRTSRSKLSKGSSYSAVIDTSSAWEEFNKIACSADHPPAGWKAVSQLKDDWKCSKGTAQRRADAFVDKQILVRRQFSGPNYLPTWFYAPAKLAAKRSKRPLQAL